MCYFALGHNFILFIFLNNYAQFVMHVLYIKCKIVHKFTIPQQTCTMQMNHVLCLALCRFLVHSCAWVLCMACICCALCICNNTSAYVPNSVLSKCVERAVIALVWLMEENMNTICFMIWSLKFHLKLMYLTLILHLSEQKLNSPYSLYFLVFIPAYQY